MSLPHDDQAAARADEPDLAAGRRVLTLEAAALTALANHLDAAFTRAVDLLAAVKGRAVLTGMGKSGHIARKIAATMASTGTPALYVHPAEASHGDLGMITRDDVVMCLSNSGETPELSDLVTYAQRFEIPVIAVVGRTDSTLQKIADVTLCLPPTAEACPMGLAPTTSTTMMLALGDALAVALLERLGFSSDQYKLLHPGGRLGQRLIKVEELMHAGPDLPIVAADTPMTEVILEMTAKSFGCVAVVDDAGRLIGVCTDGDLRRRMGADLLSARAAEVMTATPQIVDRDALAAEALHRMNTAERPFTSLFIVADGRPVGLVHIHDLLRAGVA